MNARGQTVHVFGAGAIGLALAAHLAEAGRKAVAVRTSEPDADAVVVNVTVRGSDRTFEAPVEVIPLNGVKSVESLAVIDG